MTEKINRKRKLYLELLRIFAILCVIFNHTDGFFAYYSSTQNGITWLYSAVLSVICRVGVPLFFMISGAVLLDKEESLKELFRKRILRIGIVLLLFSLVQYAVAIFRGRVQEYSFLLFFKGILEGTIEETYWFLYAYLGILFLLPLLRKMVRGMAEVEFRYLLVMGIGLEVAFRVLGIFNGIEVQSQLYMMNLYLYFFLMGYYLEYGKDKILQKVKKYLYIIMPLIIIIAVVTVRLDFMRTGNYDVRILDLWTPVFAMGIFLAAKRLCDQAAFAVRTERIVMRVASCSFGIYLLEKLTRIILLPVYLFLSDKTVGILACSVYVAGTYIVAWGITAGLKCVPGIRRLL